MERTVLLFLLEVTAKATTIVGVTALACWSLRRASAALRHFVWAAALAGVLALPALALLVPDWHLTLLPAPLSVGAMVSGAEETPLPSAAADVPRDVDAAMPVVDARPQRARSAAPRTVEATASPITERTIADRPIANPQQPINRLLDRRMIPSLFLTLWIAGAMVALGRLFAGHAHLWWMERHADAITDPAWLELARRVADQLRLAAPNGGGTARTSAIRLLRCRRPTMPVCWGVRRPSLLLPSDADSWNVERRRIVLLHELAHAKRRDCLTQVLAQVAIAMHWFNPLVWLAVRRLRVERERACDDLVLASGANAPDYADHLLDIARAFRTAGCPSWAAVAMARPSQLEGRLLAILDRHRDRRALTRPAGAAAAVLVVAMVGTLAAVQPAPAPADAPSSPQAVAKSRPLPTPADASGTTTVAVLPGDAQPAPVPSPRPMIAPKPDLPDLIEVERVAEDAALAVDADAIAEQEAKTAVPKIARADARPDADPKIVAALATALQDQNADVRRQAASTLADLRSPQALDALIAATMDADRDVRVLAVHAISRHRSDAVTQALVRALKDADAEVRRAAIHGVARLRDPQYVDVLTAALKDADPEVRAAAAHGLAQLRDARAVPGLIVALKDANAAVRQHAAHALGQIGDARAVDPLVVALTDTEDGVREVVVHALGQIGRRAGARERK